MVGSSQQLSNGPYPQPFKFNPKTYHSFNVHFNIIPTPTPEYSQRLLSFRYSYINVFHKLLISAVVATCSDHPTLLDSNILLITGDECKS